MSILLDADWIAERFGEQFNFFDHPCQDVGKMLYSNLEKIPCCCGANKREKYGREGCQLLTIWDKT
jgi:hypothetical protein